MPLKDERRLSAEDVIRVTRDHTQGAETITDPLGQQVGRPPDAGDLSATGGELIAVHAQMEEPLGAAREKP